MQYLSQRHTTQLLSLLNVDNQRLQQAAQEFKSTIPDSERFAACCAIALLLEDGFLLKPAQRITSWFVLSSNQGVLEPGKRQSEATATYPFSAILVKAAANEQLSPAERHFVSLLLLNRCKEFEDCTATHYLEKYNRQPHPKALDLTSVKASIAKRNPQVPSSPAADAPPPSKQAQHKPPSTRPPVPPPIVRHFHAPWERPRPPVLTPPPSELKFMHRQPAQELVWDSSVGEDTSPLRHVQELLSKALKGPLLPAQQQQVLRELEADPSLVFRLGLTPKQLPEVVENTPVIAYEVLLRLMHSHSMAAYLEVLASMELSLHSMEVVNRLTTAVDLPSEFVHLYITNCINSCEGIQDKYMQNRLVRLVCVFLQSLIRQRIINIRDLLHEVQAFCINFSRIREAASLFRRLKQLEAAADGVGPAQVASNGHA